MLLQTTTTKDNAKMLIAKALQNRLSPCIQQMEIQSHYVWRDTQNARKIMCEDEILLSFKVFKKDFKNLKKLVLKHHIYELPEIIGIKLYKVSKYYKNWCQNAF